jgi:hypothetical protein
MKTRLSLSVALAALVLVTAPLAAHHSFAPFAMDAERTITGTVTQFDWTNPHTWIWLEVPNDKGSVDKWGVEGMSPNYLARRGWSKTTLKIGEKISIVVHPMKDGSNAGTFIRAMTPDGKPLLQTGQPTEP